MTRQVGARKRRQISVSQAERASLGADIQPKNWRVDNMTEGTGGGGEGEKKFQAKGDHEGVP